MVPLRTPNILRNQSNFEANNLEKIGISQWDHSAVKNGFCSFNSRLKIMKGRKLFFDNNVFNFLMPIKNCFNV